jgi:hypothetical protein
MAQTIDGARTLRLAFALKFQSLLQGALMTGIPFEAYLAGYFFGRDGRRAERRFDAVGVEIKAYAEGIVDGRRTARAAEDWRQAIEHEHGVDCFERALALEPV